MWAIFIGRWTQWWFSRFKRRHMSIYVKLTTASSLLMGRIVFTWSLKTQNCLLDLLTLEIWQLYHYHQYWRAASWCLQKHPKPLSKAWLVKFSFQYPSKKDSPFNTIRVSSAYWSTMLFRIGCCGKSLEAKSSIIFCRTSTTHWLDVQISSRKCLRRRWMDRLRQRAHTRVAVVVDMWAPNQSIECEYMLL